WWLREEAGSDGRRRWQANWSLAEPQWTSRKRTWRNASRPPDHPKGAISDQCATRRRKLPWGMREVPNHYGVRSAVTSRASRIEVLVTAARRQEASKFGQACCEQSRPTGRTSSRSALASACGVEASTLGAKPGNTVSAAAMNAAMAIAEKALIMTVPCHGPWRPRRFVGWTCSQRKFPAVFTGPENGFVPAEFCFVGQWRTKHCRLAQ